MIRSVLLTLVLLSGCSRRALPSSPPPRGPNQCLRSEIFQACLAHVPQGPRSTAANDWDEVVSECASAAYYQSIRLVRTIPEGCR